jgi:hypothetical protein
MPTLDFIDGFEHQVLSSNRFGGGNGTGIWDGVNTGGGGLSYVAGRNGQALRIAEPGTSVIFCQTILPTTRTRVGSLYFRTSAIPSSGARFLELWDPTSASTIAFFFISAVNGRLEAQADGGTTQTTGATTFADGLWHLLDFFIDSSANPWVLKWKVDGVAYTDATVANAASDSGSLFFGTRQSTDTATVQFDDAVFSATAADYPIGPHDVLYGVPTGDNDKTHGGTNVVEANGGADIDGVAAYALLDEVPATTADYIQQVATGVGNYAEVTFDDQPGGKTIWGVSGFLAAFASATTASADGTTRVVDGSNNTLTDIYAGDMSETALHYRRAMIAAPGGGWDSGYAGVKARVGFSGTVTSQPRWAALMLQYATAPAGAVPPTRKLRVVTNPLRW